MKKKMNEISFRYFVTLKGTDLLGEYGQTWERETVNYLKLRISNTYITNVAKYKFCEPTQSAPLRVMLMSVHFSLADQNF